MSFPVIVVLKGRSNDSIAIAIFSLQLMGCMGYNVSVHKVQWQQQQHN